MKKRILVLVLLSFLFVGYNSQAAEKIDKGSSIYGEIKGINSKEIGNKIYEALLNNKESLKITGYGITNSETASEVANLYLEVLDNHPELFYAGNVLEYKYWTNGNFEFQFSYLYKGKELTTKKAEFKQKVDYIIRSVITEDMSEVEKELAIHDYIVLNTRYDQDNYIKNTVPRESYTAYGALINGVAVCDGYSRAFKLLLDEIGIPCIKISSEGINHAWNIVTINGKRYHVDVTR